MVHLVDLVHSSTKCSYIFVNHVCFECHLWFCSVVKHIIPLAGRQMPIEEGKGLFRITKGILGISIAVVATILGLPLCIFFIFKLRNSKEISNEVYKSPKGTHAVLL